MKEKRSSPRGYTYLKLFCIFTLFLIFFVGIARGVGMYQNRSFRGSSYVTLYSNGDTHYLVSYHAPNSYVVAELLNTPNLSLERASRAQLSFALEVPIDAVVVDPSLTSAGDIFSLSGVLRMMVFSHTYILRDINAVDALKYFWLSTRVPPEEKSSVEVDYGQPEEGELSSLFQDRDIFNSAVSIEVMNGTSVSGLGGAFAEVLVNRGYNVIAVTNTEDAHKKSFVHFNRSEGTATALSLLHLFSGAIDHDVQIGQSADIVVVVGGDVAR